MMHKKGSKDRVRVKVVDNKRTVWDRLSCYIVRWLTVAIIYDCLS